MGACGDIRAPFVLFSLTIAIQLICLPLLVATDDDIIESIVHKDADGTEREELAFRAPMKGVPEQVLTLYCANVKVRIYWGYFREEVKESHRKGIHMRRMARLARHIFDDIRDVDKPFNATMLSTVDDYFAVGEVADDSMLVEKASEDQSGLPRSDRFAKRKLKELKSKFSKGHGKSAKDGSSEKDQEDSQAPEEPFNADDIETSDSYKALIKQDLKDSAKKIKQFVVEWAPKVALGIYTRWRTMWWMMMSCLYAKYYLWDPSLDEFTKLKRSLIMFPEFQLLKLQDIDCKPTKFFKRILDVCKLLNPLMNYSFGQLSLDKMTRFKSDMT